MNAYRLHFTIFIALLASLILHLLILISFLYIESNKTNNPDKNRDNIFHEQAKKDALKWVAQKARASQFGAPVIFKDEPEKTIKKHKDQTDSTDQDTLNFQQIVQSTKEEPPIEEQKIPFPEKQEEPLKVQRKKNVISKYLPKYTRSKQPNQKPSKSMQQPQLASLQKKSLTLAQLTKGFLEHMKDEGKHRITTIGKEEQIPTAEQLKHERYMEKLSWCLQNSFKINSNKFPTTKPVKTILRVYLALNQNGTVKELKIVESSGNRLLDQFVHYIFRDASSSFPPVPHYFPQSPYTITYIVEINPVRNTRIGLHLL